MQTDRNLLFGVLAFQDEYIDLAQLAAICRAWAADKSHSIPPAAAGSSSGGPEQGRTNWRAGGR